MMYINISSKELKDLMASSKNVLIIDVRTPEEFAEGYIEGSINMPVGVVSVDKIYDLCNLEQEDVENIVVIVCRSGVRSVNCINGFVAEHSYDSGLNVQFYNLENGVVDWVAEGNQLVTIKK